MYILGISCYYHDASAALLKDGVIVAAAEEERFTRKKHDSSFPINAVQFCLNSQNVSIEDISYIGFYEKPFLKFERVLFQHLQMFPLSLKTFLSSIPSWLTEKLRVVRAIRKKLKYKKNILFVEHHLAHAASSFLVSPFDSAAIVTLDGVGEWTTTTYGVGNGNDIHLMKHIVFPHSLGLLYSTITAYLGMSVNNSEYKCLHPNTFIHLASGSLVRIEELFHLDGTMERISSSESLLHLETPIIITSLDKNTLKLRNSTVHDVYRKKATTQLYNIELLSGRKVCVTANHKFSTIDSFGNYCTLQAQDLKNLDFIIIPKVLKNNNNKTISEFWAYLLAYSIAESHEFVRETKHEAEIRLGCADYAIIEDFKYIVSQLGKSYRVWSDKRRPNMFYIATSVWKDLKFLHEKLHYAFGKDAPEKDIPSFIMTNSDHVKKGFLKRLFDCDAGFTGHQLIYSSSSVTLINSISYLLLHFGVHSRIRTIFNKKYQKNYYRIEINGRWLEVFDKNIGFSLKRKQTLLKRYITSVHRFGNNIDFIPINALLTNSWLHLGKKKKDLYKEVGRHFWSFSTKNEEYRSYPTTDFVVRYYNRTKLKTLKKFADNDILFDQVKKIEKIDFDGYVYDIIVPEDHTFIGGDGGILLHNTMGLAAYGDMSRLTNPYYKKLLQVIDIKDDGSYRLDMRYFIFHYADRMPSPLLCSLLDGPITARDSEMTQRHKDIAAAVQLITEDVITKILCHVHKETKLSSLVLAGGVALNSVYNGKIIRTTPFKQVWIQPNASDGGTSIGVASYIYHTLLCNKRNYVQDNAYLGPSFTEKDIKTFLDSSGITYTTFSSDKELLDQTAALLYNNKVVGWFQLGMEWGPRALGARSILANPMNPKAKELLNEKVKHRERFRPFAPVVCADDAERYFSVDNPLPEPTDYMLMVYPILQKWHHKIPSVTHADGSGRLQTVRRHQNPLYYDLIKRFGKISNIPILINTSFNIRGEPIVCSPQDAYRCMMGTGIDYLVLGKFLIKRDDNPKDIWDSEVLAKD